MDQPPPAPGLPVPGSNAATTSLFARMANVFAVPGEVFEEIKSARASVANWLVPVLLYGLVGAVSAVLILSQPAITQQIHEQQAKVFEDRVKAGKMSRADADKALAMSETMTGPTVLKITGTIAAFCSSFVSVFWWAFLLWLIGRLGLNTKLDFMKLVEVTGLASIISTLAVIISMLLVVSFSNPLASPSLAMLMHAPNPQSPVFKLLSLVNLMTFWVLAVRAIGLAKLSGVSFGKAARWVFGAWLLMMSLLTGFSLAVQAVLGHLK